MPQMASYRQQALAVADGLTRAPSCPLDLRALAQDAAKILQGSLRAAFQMELGRRMRAASQGTQARVRAFS